MVLNKKGFTIVELMIAMTIFAVAITLVLAGVIFIGRQYQQGSNRTALEEASRTIHEQIGQSMKYSDGSTDTLSNSTYNAKCIGGNMYVYNGKPPLTTTYIDIIEGLWLKDPGQDCEVANLNTNDAINLLIPGTKVMYFEINNDTFTTVFLKAPPDGDDLIDTTGLAEDIKCDYTKPGREFCSSVKITSTSIGRISN